MSFRVVFALKNWIWFINICLSATNYCWEIKFEYYNWITWHFPLLSFIFLCIQKDSPRKYQVIENDETIPIGIGNIFFFTQMSAYRAVPIMWVTLFCSCHLLVHVFSFAFRVDLFILKIYVCAAPNPGRCACAIFVTTVPVPAKLKHRQLFELSLFPWCDDGESFWEIFTKLHPFPLLGMIEFKIKSFPTFNLKIKSINHLFLLVWLMAVLLVRRNHISFPITLMQHCILWSYAGTNTVLLISRRLFFSFNYARYLNFSHIWLIWKLLLSKLRNTSGNEPHL